MTEFVAGEYDILVCTTIIESGWISQLQILLSLKERIVWFIPTLSIGAEGLADSKGRPMPICWSIKCGITDKARKRLSSIRQINNFGAGFRIALRDLSVEPEIFWK